MVVEVERRKIQVWGNAHFISVPTRIESYRQTHLLKSWLAHGIFAICPRQNLENTFGRIVNMILAGFLGELERL